MPRWMAEWLAGPVLSLQFLTAVPIPVAMPAEPRHLGRALACFPLAGALIGLALALLDGVARRAFPALPEAAVVLTVLVLLTGGLHLDGLMDTADGVFGGRSAQRRLEIMRDSRVGSYGVLAGGLALLLKAFSIAALPVSLRFGALAFLPVAGRWSMACSLAAFRSARAEGLGATFKAGARWWHAALATLFTLALAWVTLGSNGLALLVLAIAVASTVASFLSRQLGGLTGDCYGAVNEVVEIALLLALIGQFPLPAGEG